MNAEVIRVQVKDIINENISIVPEDMRLEMALTRMKKQNIGILIVRDDHHVAGILAARNILMRQGVNKDSIKRLKVRDVMDASVHFIYEDQHVQQVRAIMQMHNISHIIVLNRENKIKGICTRRDVGLAMVPENMASRTEFNRQRVLKKENYKDIS